MLLLLLFSNEDFEEDFEPGLECTFWIGDVGRTADVEGDVGNGIKEPSCVWGDEG
jgi:hypothetical protein